MLRARILSALHAMFIGVVVFVSPARAQNADLPGTVSEMPLPGGLRGALAAVDDRAAPDHGQFLLEFIRRSYDTPHGGKSDDREAVLQALVAQLDRSSLLRYAPDSRETLPLPLPAALWIDAVFGGRATPQTLVSAILRSRSAALLYHGLLSLDDPTRAWLATQPELIADLASRHPAAFVAAAAGLRVSGTTVRVPGGELAEPAWQALVGRRANDPADFVRALLAQGEGRLAYFFGAMAELPPAQIRLALNLDSADVAGRIDAARRLYATFERIAPGWKVEERAFRRPSLDAALLLADLRVDDSGRPVLPGTRRFWTAAFADADRGRAKSSRVDDGSAFAEGEPVDFAWLCEQIFKAEEGEQRRRYQLVLFASRVVGRVTPDNARDAIDAVRSAGSYPALVAVLERAKLVDVAAFASAARRAAQLSAIDDEPRALRALAQFQGTLALVTRAALRGSLPADSLSSVVSSLSAVDLSERGDYEGRLVRWLDGWLAGSMAAQARVRSTPALKTTAVSGGSQGEDPKNDADKNDVYMNEVYEHASAPMDRDLFRMLTGPAAVEPRFVDWEGTRYRLDLAWAEATRLARLLGEHPRPYLTSARALVAIADALGEAGLTREGLRREADAFDLLAQAVAWQGADASSSGLGWEGTGVPGRYREVASTLSRAARDADVRAASRLAPALRMLADELLARGLLELVYAVALGQGDRASVSAADVATRHDFGLRPIGIGTSDPWQLPIPSAVRGWHVTGSLLGLDVRLADLSLMRISAKAPSKKPTLNEGDRRVLVDAVALVQSASLTEADRDTIVAAIRKGRERLAAVRTPGEAAALADEIRLGPARRTLLPWVVAHEPARVAAFLSPSELLWLGLEKKPVDPRLHAWGSPGEPRLGCLCLQLLDRRPWETLAGRRNSGMLASGFPDLNLRLAELLAELQMPAQLLGPVLAAATLDFINTVTSRDPDDRRGLVEFVQALRLERVEEYLALLTTDGPLVPTSDASQPAAAGARTGVPR